MLFWTEQYRNKYPRAERPPEGSRTPLSFDLTELCFTGHAVSGDFILQVWEKYYNLLMVMQPYCDVYNVYDVD